MATIILESLSLQIIREPNEKYPCGQSKIVEVKSPREAAFCKLWLQTASGGQPGHCVNSLEVSCRSQAKPMFSENWEITSHSLNFSVITSVGVGDITRRMGYFIWSKCGSCSQLILHEHPDAQRYSGWPYQCTVGPSAVAGAGRWERRNICLSLFVCLLPESIDLGTWSLMGSQSKLTEGSQHGNVQRLAEASLALVEAWCLYLVSFNNNWVS